jgi:phage tail sheath gpL-like
MEQSELPVWRLRWPRHLRHWLSADTAVAAVVVSTVAAEAFMVAWAVAVSVVAWAVAASVVAWPWAAEASVAAVHTSLAELIEADMATDMVVGTAEAMVVMEATDMGRASWAVYSLDRS